MRRTKEKRNRLIVLLSFLTGCLMLAFLFNRIRSVYGQDISVSYDRMTEETEAELQKEEVPQSLIELAKMNPETIPFVKDYPEFHEKASKITISGKELHYRSIPLFLQWDKRWGYKKYGGGYLALNGCGPTCLSMVHCGLTGKTKWNPYRVAKMSEKNGFYKRGEGTSWDLMRRGAEMIGLVSSEVVFDKAHIVQALRDGKPIICAMRPGDFTTTGHYIVLIGVTENGSIVVNDPNSKKRSGKTWELDRIMKQVKNLWCYRIK